VQIPKNETISDCKDAFRHIYTFILMGILLASFFSFKGWNIYYKFDHQLE